MDSKCYHLLNERLGRAEASDQASDKSSGKKRQAFVERAIKYKEVRIDELARTSHERRCQIAQATSSLLNATFRKSTRSNRSLCFSHLKLKSSSNNNSGAVEHLGPDASEKPVPDPCALFDIFMPYALCGAMASLRFDLIMSQHDQNHIAICEEDLVYKFCWCLGVCMKDRHFGDRHLDEMESIVRSIQIKLVEPIKASALKAKEVDADKSKEAKRLIRLRKNSKSSLEEDSEEDGLLGEVSQLEKSNRLRENRARPGAPSNDADENEKSVLSSDANVVETRAKRYFRAGAEEGAERRRIKKSSDGTAEDSDEYDYEGDMNNDDRFAWEDEDDMEYSRSKKRFSSSNRGVQSNQKASEESSTTFTVSPGIRLKKGNQVIFDAANSTFSLEQKLGFKIPPLTREMTRHAELLENISFVLRANYVHVALLDGVISAAQEHTKSLVQRNRKVLTHKESSSTPTRPHRSYSLVDLDTQYEDLPITRKQIYSSLSGNKKLMHLLSLLELSNHPQQLSGLTNLVPWMIRQELPPKVSDAALVSEFLVSFGHLMIELDRWTYAKENEEKKNKQLRLLMQQEAENKQRNADVFMEVLGMMESTERRELEAESEKRIKAAKIEETKSFDEKSFEETAEKLEKDLILPFDYSSHFDSLFTHVDTIQHPNVPFSITLHWILSKMSILDECTIIEFVKWLVYNPPPSDSLNPRLHLLSKYPEFVQQLLRQLSLYAPPKLQTVRQLLFESILLPLASQSPFVHLQILLYLHAAKTRYTISIKDCISLVHALATSHAFSAHFRVQEIRRAYFLLAQLLGSYCHTHQQRTCLAYTFHFLEPTFDLSPHLSP
ncbi:uncharacterized protein LOC126325954 [Schistocerca gregaria]|uniref:uncharacterized protein LOC126325954 n=1 Tax=Schistocerca gregaria TaxID=7010 RepID=UPI00211F1F34|nr:uncharacterized protein LOC126325954 [Schistocerca gregaria]